MLGAVLVTLITAMAIFAPLMTTHDPTQIMVGPRLATPSLDFFLGTDQLGRDTFSRTTWAAASRSSLLSPPSAVHWRSAWYLV
ncbi:hypothetical protein [Mesorhizobium sp.]|uniref:hypothetical protein n=1 Tax=Mesorhizobium sp. TaxID=1871066 RepID=UPI0034501BB7